MLHQVCNIDILLKRASAHVEMPIIRTMIDIASIMNETDYWEVGVSLKDLGFEEMDLKQILNYVNYGKI